MGGTAITEGNSYDVGDLIGGGDHTDDCSYNSRHSHVYSLFRWMLQRPREYMSEKLNILGCVA